MTSTVKAKAKRKKLQDVKGDELYRLLHEARDMGYKQAAEQHAANSKIHEAIEIELRQLREFRKVVLALCDGRHREAILDLALQHERENAAREAPKKKGWFR